MAHASNDECFAQDQQAHNRWAGKCSSIREAAVSEEEEDALTAP